LPAGTTLEVRLSTPTGSASHAGDQVEGRTIAPVGFRGQILVPQVCRSFEFADGVPPEYYSFTDCEDHRRKRGHTIEQIVPLSVWRATVAEERKLGTGHALPGPIAAPDHFVS